MNRLLGLGTIVLAIGYLVGTSRLPSVRLGDPLGPAIFPYVIGILMLVVGAVLILSPRAAGNNGDAVLAAPALGELAAVAGILAWSALYFYFFEAVGYVPSTLVYLLVLLLYMNPGRYAVNAGVAIAYTVVSYWLFSTLGVRLAAF